jgi:rubrerythrin
MITETMFFERQTLSLTLIERELYRLYANLSEKVEDMAARAMLSYIATDSLKHSTILVKIIEEVEGSKAREQDCTENIRYAKKVIKTLGRKVEKSKKVDRNEFITLIDTLIGFETLLYNEYKKAFHLEYTCFSEHELDKEPEADLNIFDLIVNDEDLHQRILLSLVRFCDRKLSFNKNAPVVRYKNPDSWYVPPRGRRS